MAKDGNDGMSVADADANYGNHEVTISKAFTRSIS